MNGNLIITESLIVKSVVEVVNHIRQLEHSMLFFEKKVIFGGMHTTLNI